MNLLEVHRRIHAKDYDGSVDGGSSVSDITRAEDSFHLASSQVIVQEVVPETDSTRE